VFGKITNAKKDKHVLTKWKIIHKYAAHVSILLRYASICCGLVASWYSWVKSGRNEWSEQWYVYIWNNIVLPIFIVRFMVNRPGNHMKPIFGSSVYRSQSAPPLWFDWDKGHRSSQAQDHTCRHYLGSVKSSNANVWLKDKRHHIVKYGVYIVTHDYTTKLGTRIIYHIIPKNTNQSTKIKTGFYK
jgi:hypothetical protein